MSTCVQRVDARGLMERAGPFLLEREDEHNLLLGLVDSMPSYLAVVLRDGEVLGAALQSSRGLVLSRVADPGVVDAVVEDLTALGVALPGVIGPPAASRRFVEQWTSRSHRRWAMRIHRADAVTPPTGVSGALRPVTSADRELLSAWCAGFIADANPPDVDDPVAQVDGWLAQPGTTWVWADGGQPVSMARYGGPTPHGVRINAVYTPVELRGRGYASACVAALTQRLLSDGWEFTTLFTDLANPTSNRIYARIGYRRVCDMDHYRFSDP